MSSILKALRKLEEEKAALGEEGVDIARDILKRSARKSDRNLFWPILSAVLFVMLVGAGVFFWLDKQPEVSANNPQQKKLQENPVQKETALKEFIPKQVPVKASAKKESTQTDELPVNLDIMAPVVKPQTVPQENREPAALSRTGLPFLKVVGIAYRENPAERIAIINDLPVMQGTAIEGAQVLEIRPDRVIFDWKGRKFEQQVEDAN